MPIKYRAGYKYQLAETYMIVLIIQPEQRIVTDYVRFEIDGALTIEKGYAWDGPSGPTLDTSDFMRGSLVHDVLYQLLRMGLLPSEKRGQADDLLMLLCVEDGMPQWRVKLVHEAVQRFAAGAAKAGTEKPIITAGV